MWCIPLMNFKEGGRTDAEVYGHVHGEAGRETQGGKSGQHKGTSDRQKERACRDRLKPKQIMISVLIIAQGKGKSNGKYQNQ